MLWTVLGLTSQTENALTDKSMVRCSYCPGIKNDSSLSKRDMDEVTIIWVFRKLANGLSLTSNLQLGLSMHLVSSAGCVCLFIVHVRRTPRCSFTIVFMDMCLR
jgi:hypothetical protein